MSGNRLGATLIELTMVVSIIAVVLGYVVPRVGDSLDKIAVRSAASDLKMAYLTARIGAVGRGRMLAVHVHARDTSMVVSEPVSGDTVLLRYLGRVHGVAVRTTRDSMVYSMSGLGQGGANSSIYVTRRAAAETVRVSREGRAR